MAASKLLNSAPIRKGRAFANRIPRLFIQASAHDDDFRAAPPIVVNSLPKSGTHLLMQLAEALPGTRQFKTFLAQTPSLTLRMRTQSEIDRKIAGFVPGEIIGAHLHHSAATAKALEDRNALHLFIWRDPRDVILSEAHYLAEMTRFHAMHRSFKALPTAEARVELAITGNGGNYPDAKERIGSYMGWTQTPGTVSLRYESLIHPETQKHECQRILDAYKARVTGVANLPTADDLVAAIAPEKSHTFNKGGIARWKQEMSPAHQAMCHERLGPWLDE